MKDIALTPANYITSQEILKDKTKEYADEVRTFQGIPTIEVTSRANLFVAFYSGKDGEKAGNFIVLVRGDKDLNFNRPCLVIEHLSPMVRCYDPCLWIDPNGRLWLFYSQSYDFYDGRLGVWAAVCDNPDQEELIFKEARRLTNGIMMNKPTVLSSGEWLFPVAIWKVIESEHNHLPEERYSNVYMSTDQGKTFKLIGKADYEDRLYDEHMLLERKDSSILMLIRGKAGIGQALSYDKGYNWEEIKDSGFPSPSSRFCIRRLKSGNVLFVNHYKFTGRNNLTAMISRDDAKTFEGFLLLDERQGVSYPDMAEDSDGNLYIVYDYDRCKEKEILIAKVREEDILAGQIICESSRLKLIANKAYD